MKKHFFCLIIICSLFSACGQTSNSSANFKVYGNCGMCKKTIETSLKVDGVDKADWNDETKMIDVQFDSTKITLTQIHEKIAAAGYDTELKKGSDEAYDKLHGCCKYDRKKE